MDKRGALFCLLLCTDLLSVSCGEQERGLSLICGVMFTLITKAALINERAEDRVREVGGKELLVQVQL